MDLLTELAPPFIYFGSLEGDGAEIGFWVDWDAVETAIHDRGILRCEAGDPTASGERIEVNDHGNATLYDADGRIVWSTV